MTQDKNYVLVATAVLIDVDNRVLIGQRPEGKPMAGFWEFPGGKLEPYETPEAALKRELMEELNVTTLEKAFFPLTFMTPEYDHGNGVILLYGCRNWKGPIKGLENQKFAWVKPVRLLDYDLLPANKAVVPILRDMI